MLNIDFLIYIPFSIREKVAEGRMREKPFNNQPAMLIYSFSFLIMPFSLTCHEYVTSSP
jgi:hypothetical protein